MKNLPLAIAVIAVVLSIIAIGVSVGAEDEAAPAVALEAGYTSFEAHCDRALDESREGHMALLAELGELTADTDEYVAKADEVAEDAMRDVCGVKVHEAHTQPDRSFADFVGN